jgi:thioredoxin 2
MDTRNIRCPHCGRVNRVPAAGDGLPRCGSCRNALPWIADAGDGDFAEVAEAASPFVLVDFWATWCGPCRMVSPALEQVATDMAGRIKLVKVDIDRNPYLAQRFDVQAVPTLLLMHRGEVVARRAGAASAPALASWVEQSTAGWRSTTGG